MALCGWVSFLGKGRLSDRQSLIHTVTTSSKAEKIYKHAYIATVIFTIYYPPCYLLIIHIDIRLHNLVLGISMSTGMRRNCAAPASWLSNRGHGSQKEGPLEARR